MTGRYDRAHDCCRACVKAGRDQDERIEFHISQAIKHQREMDALIPVILIMAMILAGALAVSR